MISKSQAAIDSAKFVHVRSGGGRNNWTVHGPADCSEPHGPKSFERAASYRHAQTLSTLWRARVALGLMGRLTEHRHHEMGREHFFDQPRGLRTLIDLGLAIPREVQS